jgi:2-dehydro-3-deoxygalactonokinase
MTEMTSEPNPPVVGIDWGTTNRRTYVLGPEGELVHHHSDELGILAVAGNFEKALADLLTKIELDHADVIMSGMIGSRNGWRQVPYLSTEQPISALPDAMVDIDTKLPNVRCRIVPGYQFIDPYGIPDVMRGEETQVFGALSLYAPSGWFVLPGTHSKWVRIEQGRISEIMTFMTGELFALLSRHGTLAALMEERQAWAPSAFEAGLSSARHDNFTHTAFGCRALVVTDTMPASHASSYLSGLLVGSELHQIRKGSIDQTEFSIQVIGSATLEERYMEALRFFGMSARVWQPDEVYVAALRTLAGFTIQQ